MQDALEFAGSPAVGIGGLTRKPLRDDTGWVSDQDDAVELLVELHLGFLTVATNSTSVSSVARSSWMASSRHCWRPPGSGSDQPLSVSIALYSAGGQCLDNARLAGSRHASQ